MRRPVQAGLSRARFPTRSGRSLTLLIHTHSSATMRTHARPRRARAAI